MRPLSHPHCAPPPVPGVIFQTRKDGSLPPHVHYKIRQNSSFTEKTNEIRRAYWRPGPNTGGRFYFLYGFVWIQGEDPPWGPGVGGSPAAPLTADPAHRHDRARHHQHLRGARRGGAGQLRSDVPLPLLHPRRVSAVWGPRGGAGAEVPALTPRLPPQLPVCHRAHDAAVHGDLLGVLGGHDHPAHRGGEGTPAEGGRGRGSRRGGGGAEAHTRSSPDHAQGPLLLPSGLR